MSGRREAAVVIVAAPGQDRRVRALLVGLEEEGVPAQVVGIEAGEFDREDACALAGAAARRAGFDVGIGVAADGSAHIRHARLPPEHLGGCGPAADQLLLRLLGQDAGRLVTCLPLRHLPGLSNSSTPRPPTTTHPNPPKENP